MILSFGGKIIWEKLKGLEKKVANILSGWNLGQWRAHQKPNVGRWPRKK